MSRLHMLLRPGLVECVLLSKWGFFLKREGCALTTIFLRDFQR